MSKRKNKKKKSSGIIILVAVLCLIGVLGFAVTQGGLLGKIQDNIVNNFIEQKSYRLTCGDTVIPANQTYTMDIATEETAYFNLGGAFSDGYTVEVHSYISNVDSSSPAFNYTYYSTEKSRNITSQFSSLGELTEMFAIDATHTDYFTFRIPAGTSVMNVLKRYHGVDEVSIGYGENQDDIINGGFYNFCIRITTSEPSVWFQIRFRITTYYPENVAITEQEVFVI